MTIDELHEKMKADPALARSYIAYFRACNDDRVKALTRELARKLNEYQRETALAFAAENGFSLEADSESDVKIRSINRSICSQLDEMIRNQMGRGTV